jgi:hypothetical protein
MILPRCDTVIEQLMRPHPLVEGSPVRHQALRQEEAGVAGRVSPLPIGSYYDLREEDDGSTSPSQAIVFSRRVTDKLSKWDEKGQRRR